MDIRDSLWTSFHGLFHLFILCYVLWGSQKKSTAITFILNVLWDPHFIALHWERWDEKRKDKKGGMPPSSSRHIFICFYGDRFLGNWTFPCCTFRGKKVTASEIRKNRKRITIVNKNRVLRVTSSLRYIYLLKSTHRTVWYNIYV